MRKSIFGRGFFILCVLCLSAIVRKRKDVWIIGENMGRLSYDNGYHFFRHCTTRTGAQAYFVVDSAYTDSSLPEESVLAYGSLRHAYYLAAAGVLVYSHSHRDLMYSTLYRLLHKTRKIVQLKHGVTALKQFNEDYMSRRNDMDVFIVVSETEKDVVSRCIGTDRHRIAVTGFARFDRYDIPATVSRTSPRKILYMPTWRDWLVETGFESSSLYARTRELLESEWLKRVLAVNSAQLTFLLHINMRQYVDHYRLNSSELINIEYAQQVRVQDLIVDNDILITDYSSIAWDFLYLEKPVVFYQFDLADYLEHRGSCIDLDDRENLFGLFANNEEEVTQYLETLLTGYPELSPRDRACRDRWFDYFDKHNCKRIYAEIERVCED